VGWISKPGPGRDRDGDEPSGPFTEGLLPSKRSRLERALFPRSSLIFLELSLFLMLLRMPPVIELVFHYVNVQQGEERMDRLTYYDHVCLSQ
jgi:hypothetical protein